MVKDRKELTTSPCVLLDTKLYPALLQFCSNTKTLLFFEDVVPEEFRCKKTDSKTRGASGSRSISIAEPPKGTPVEDEVNEELEPLNKRQADQDSSDDELGGKELFGFKTPKRTRMSKKVVHNDDKVDSKNTPGKPSKSQAKKIEATTPYRLASRHTNNECDELSDESSIESSDDEAVSQALEDTNSTSALSSRTSNQPIPSLAEDFFRAQSNKPVTSDHTLAKLRQDGLIDQQTIRQVIDSRPNHHVKSSKLLMSEHYLSFRTWMLQLCLGFNMVLYGYGSKKALVEKFRKEFCSDYHCVVINGFFPSLTLKNIISSIYEDCLQLAELAPDADTALNEIADYLTTKDEALFVFVHSIDSSMMRSTAIQSFLATLGSIENVHLVASVDHINSALLWDQAMSTKFNWVWYDATTFEPYLEETSYENSLMSQQTSGLALKSMVNVFKSLTPNAKSIFILVAKYHLEHAEEQSYMGMPFQMLYQKCREGFLVNSDQTLRTQLIEFRDHKLIRSKKGVDGAEHLYLPTDLSTLRDFIEKNESSQVCG